MKWRMEYTETDDEKQELFLDMTDAEVAEVLEKLNSAEGEE